MFRKGWLFEVFLVCVGVVIGSLIAELARPLKALGWLAYSLSFGLPQELQVNLHIVDLRFGIQLNLSVAVIICVILSLVLGHLLAGKSR